MASLLDLLLAATDPISAIILGGIYLRIRALTDRVNRLEGTFITESKPRYPTPQRPQEAD